MPEEVRFFGRFAGYALLVTLLYWFLSRDPVGTVLLGAFGLASAFGSLVLGGDARRRGRTLGGRPWQWIGLTRTDEQGPFIEEPSRLPAASLAPFEVGFGLAFASLGLVFGPWLIVVGLVPAAVGAAGWLRDAMAEYRAREGPAVAPEEPAVPVGLRRRTAVSRRS